MASTNDASPDRAPDESGTPRGLAQTDSRVGGALQRIARIAARALRAPCGAVAFCDGTVRQFSSDDASGEHVAVLSRALCDRFRHDAAAPIAIGAGTASDGTPLGGALRALGMAACLAVPILRDGAAGGACFVLDRSARTWDGDDVETLRDLAAAAAADVALEEKLAAHRDVEHTLRESEARLRVAIRATGAAVWVIDFTRGGAETFDRRGCEVVGIDAERRDWPAGTLCRYFHPEDRAMMRTAFAASLAAHPEPVEYRIVRADGEMRWLQGAGEAEFDADGEPLRFVGVSFDITERKAAEAEQARLASLGRAHQEALEDADRRKNDFLAMLAHELRNPLAPILNAARILDRVGGDAPHVATAAAMIGRQVSHMARLIDDLLDVARITQGKIALRPEPVELTALLAAAVEAIGPAAAERGQSLRVNLPRAPIPLRADAVRLTQIVSNLLSNAIKYTNPGGAIELHAERDGDDALIRVKDDGIGIPESLRARIFDPFTQSSASLDRSLGGLGIGLALVKHLVGLHGGTVEALSDGPGKGSEFRVRLPCAQAPAAMPRPSQAGWTVSSRRVLVVDDNADTAQSLAEVLRIQGHDVRTAGDAAAALALADEFAPQVALLDIGLPGMDGYDLGRALRSRDALAGLLLVAVTGYGQPEDRARSRAAGFDAHFVKPVDAEEVIELLFEPSVGQDVA